MKNSRQKVILDIISNNDIETQNQLIKALEEAGVKSTQATISRDIKELRLIKELTPKGTYRYAAIGGQNPDYSDKLRNVLREGAVSIAEAQNIVVIKTLPGFANAVSSAIDNMDIDNLVGTLAGDDTCFIAMTDNAAAAKLCDIIEEYVK